MLGGLKQSVFNCEGILEIDNSVHSDLMEIQVQGVK